MPFGINFGGSKQSQNGSFTGVDNYNKTTTPTNPDWVNFGAQDIFGHTQQLGGANPTDYVAGPTPLLTTAANAAGDLSGTPWAYDAATDVTRGVANERSPQIASNIGKFMSPYLNDVVNATSNDLTANENQVRAQQALDIARSGAFGGSGAAITRGQTEGQLARARATTLSGLRDQGFTRALGGATSQAQIDQQTQAQRLAAGKQLSDIAGDYQGNLRQNIATQDAAASPIQAIQQAFAQAPLDLQAWLTSQFSGLPLALFHGQNETGTDTQSGTSNGNTGSTSFGFGLGGGK